MSPKDPFVPDNKTLAWLQAVSGDRQADDSYCQEIAGLIEEKGLNHRLVKIHLKNCSRCQKKYAN